MMSLWSWLSGTEASGNEKSHRSNVDTIWESLLSFEMDRGFLERLCKEQEWSKDFARRVIHEYKAFMFLTIVSKNEVTPSEIVDQVWHLHLIYTKSYRTFCQILGRHIDHNPGVEVDMPRFNRQYLETAALYASTFGVAVPSDIWPNAVPVVKPAASKKSDDSSNADFAGCGALSDGGAASSCGNSSDGGSSCSGAGSCSGASCGGGGCGGGGCGGGGCGGCGGG